VINSARSRPRLRGVIHHYAFFCSLLAGGVLVALAPTSRAQVGAGVYAASLSALLGTSALYHRVTWSVSARRWMGRLDHSMISVLIAGTYTPFGMLALSGTRSETLLGPIWIAACAGIALHLFWYDAPKWLSALTYVAIGWLGVLAMPGLVAQLGWTPVLLLLAGGILYSGGALIYALRRPDPVPHIFGYHEVFHSLVVVAAVAHYFAVAMVFSASG
jgi:hemolysin III